MEIVWRNGNQEMKGFGRTEMYVREKNVCEGEKVKKGTWFLYTIYWYTRVVKNVLLLFQSNSAATSIQLWTTIRVSLAARSSRKLKPSDACL